ncbi:ATP-dependent DNA helicase PIF1, partial [Glycine soja]
RKLFATMLITGSINKLEEVWKQTWHWLADDILYYQRRVLHDEALQLSDDELKNLTLLEIEKLLRSSGKSLKDYPPMPFTTTEFPSYIGNRLIHLELDFDVVELDVEFKLLFSTLTDEKLQIFNQVMQVVIEEKGGMFFLYGYGGTGKTYMWRTLASTLRAKKKIVLTVASSGIASLLLPSGRTAHSKFRIRVPTLDDSVCNITQGSDLAELLKVTSLIIWEEAPMAHKFCFKALDKTLNDIMKISDNSDTVLGGKTVVFGGDFRQILPMISRGTLHATINAFYLWSQCHVLKLTKNLRLQSNSNTTHAIEVTNFAKWILQIGDELFILNYTDPIDAIVQSTYPNIRQHYKDLEFLQSRAILASTNEIVDHINDYVLSLIPEEYLSSDSIEKFDTIESEGFSIITIEFLNSLSTSGLPNPKIKLKVGSPIMLLRNLDQNEGLCNGTRLIITRLANHIIEAKIMSGKGQGNTVYIPRLSMSPSQSPWPFKLIRRQFPIIVSYAMTINKSQGQSFASVGLYLPTTVFSHGQLYVALSRVQNKNGQKVMIHDKDKKPLSTTTNVVFKEEFQNL